MKYNEEETNDVKSQAGHNRVKRTGNHFSNYNMEKRSRQVKHKIVLEYNESKEEAEVYSPEESEMHKNCSSEADNQ